MGSRPVSLLDHGLVEPGALRPLRGRDEPRPDQGGELGPRAVVVPAGEEGPRGVDVLGVVAPDGREDLERLRLPVGARAEEDEEDLGRVVGEQAVPAHRLEPGDRLRVVREDTGEVRLPGRADRPREVVHVREPGQVVLRPVLAKAPGRELDGAVPDVEEGGIRVQVGHRDRHLGLRQLQHGRDRPRALGLVREAEQRSPCRVVLDPGDLGVEPAGRLPGLYPDDAGRVPLPDATVPDEPRPHPGAVEDRLPVLRDEPLGEPHLGVVVLALRERGRGQPRLSGALELLVHEGRQVLGVERIRVVGVVEPDLPEDVERGGPAVEERGPGGLAEGPLELAPLPVGVGLLGCLVAAHPRVRVRREAGLRRSRLSAPGTRRHARRSRRSTAAPPGPRRHPPVTGRRARGGGPGTVSGKSSATILGPSPAVTAMAPASGPAPVCWFMVVPPCEESGGGEGWRVSMKYRHQYIYYVFPHLPGRPRHLPSGRRTGCRAGRPGSGRPRCGRGGRRFSRHAHLSRGGGERSRRRCRRWMSCGFPLMERGQGCWMEETWHGLICESTGRALARGPAAGSTDGSGTVRSSSSHQPSLCQLCQMCHFRRKISIESEYHRDSFRIRPAHLAHGTLFTG